MFLQCDEYQENWDNESKQIQFLEDLVRYPKEAISFAHYLYDRDRDGE